MEETLKKAISQALESLSISDVAVELEHPSDLSHGDYSTNVAMVSGGNPKETAERIVETLNEKGIKGVEKIEVAGPGFINFHLSRDFFTDAVKKVDADFGKNDLHKGEKILFEHSSPNLFKPFHVGHVMNNVIGESAVRLAKFAGADVATISYPSDLSLGVGKAVWALLEKGIDKLQDLKTLHDKLTFLGECYAYGVKAYEEQEEIRPRVREIVQIIREGKNGAELGAYKLGKEINLSYFKDATTRLGSKFDDYIFETEAGIAGEKLVREHIGDVFEESEGAIIYRGEKDGLHTRVFINKEGMPIYEAKDLGLLKLKFDRLKPDHSVFVTDNEQGAYFEVVEHAAGKINKDWQENTTHLTHGRMSFKGGRMSSRLGGIPTAQDVLDTIQQEVLGRTDKDITKEEADVMAVGALKFSILRNAPGKNINFDPDSSLSFEGDSGPYLQYTYVRTQSLLEKAKKEGVKPNTKKPTEDATTIEKLLYRFPEVTERAAREYAPQLVTHFLLELAASFNSYYAQEKIVDAKDEYSPYKLALTKAVGTTLKNGLWLLGIEAPERM